MRSSDQEIYRELRSERLWQAAERIGLGIVYAAVGVMLIGLVSAATVVVMDRDVGPFAPIGDDQ
jgi:hypothetical protein